MKVSILIPSLLFPLSMSAQFHSIAPAGSSYNLRPSKQIEAAIPNRTSENVRETISAPSEQDAILEPVTWIHPPLRGKLRVSCGYGRRRNPFGKKCTEHHSGLDLSAKAGTPIYAMLPGVVDHCGYDARSGNYIKLRHGNFTVSYCHLLRPAILKSGTRVIPGTPVALVGSTGRSTGPHLHITLKHNGKSLDPSFLLNQLHSLNLKKND